MKSSLGSSGIRALTPLCFPVLILVIAVASGSGCGGSSGSGSSADPNLIAFVTSVQGSVDLSSWADAGGQTGVAAADAICQARAVEGGLGGGFVAWISDASNDAYCRIQNLEGEKSANCGQVNLPTAAGPWVRVDGLPFADTIDQMLKPNYRIFTPVHFDEFGDPAASSSYFTATNEEGRGNNANCDDWTDTTSGLFVGGRTNGTGAAFTQSFTASCSIGSSLLCMQAGTGPPLPSVAETGKTVFVTSTTGTGNLSSWPDSGDATGLAAGDAICNARASVAGLSGGGSYKAWLSDATTNAIDRLTSEGPWVRVDGFKVADDKADLTDETLDTTIIVTEAGDYLPGWRVWTGTFEDGTRAGLRCGEWSDGTSGQTGVVGTSNSADRNWSNVSTIDCTRGYHLYCFED